MSNRYKDLFVGLYTNRTPEWIPPEMLKRYQTESIRRRLEVCRQLWDGWPRASFYTNAVLGEQFLIGVCSYFPDACLYAPTFIAAVRQALAAWLDTIPKGKIHALFEYESLLHTYMREEYTGSLRREICEHASLPKVFTLKNFEWDICAFVKKIEYFQAVHAPDSFVKEFEPPPRFTVLAAYTKAERVIAQDVTSIVTQLQDIYRNSLIEEVKIGNTAPGNA